MNSPAVLLITFNRPQYASRQIQALRQAKPQKIFLASDAPRFEEEKALVEQVRAYYLENLDWVCEINTLFHSHNLGCSKGPIAAMSWFFEQEKEGVILEDDIIPHSHFFRFAGEMLERYRNDQKIISVSGCNLGYQGPPDSFLFSRIMNMWGWATWRDRFEQIDFDIQNWEKVKHPYGFLYSRLRNHPLDLDLNWLKFWKEKWDETIKKKDDVTWWDYQFIFNQLENKQYAVFPNRNLTSNIGFGEAATHTIHSQDERAELSMEELSFPLNHPENIKHNTVFEEVYVKKVWAEYRRPNYKYYLRKCFSGT